MCVIERMLEGYFFGGLVDPLKTLPIVGRFFARAARVLDRYVGWLARTIWARTLKIDDKKIVFITFSRMYNCNPKYICEELIHRGSDYHLVWLTGSEQAMDGNTFPDCVKQVQIGTVASFREILTAKVIVQNAHLTQELGYLPKQKGQYYIQTWHGSLGIKRFGPGYDSIKRRVRAAERAGRLNDLFLSNSRFETEEVVPVFWSGSEVCQWGHARNDILITNDPLKAAAVREHLRIPQGCKVALYAPTFRDQSSMEHYISDYDQLESALSERFGGDWIILVKLHFACRKYADDVRSGKNVINASGYADIQELMLVADVGITDYSSWIFDYMLLQRPAFLFADDIEEYKKERGLYYPITSTPFPLASTQRELCENIMAFDNGRYQSGVVSFLEEKGCMEDGQAAKRAVDRIESVMKKNEESSRRERKAR